MDPSSTSEHPMVDVPGRGNGEQGQQLATMAAIVSEIKECDLRILATRQDVKALRKTLTKSHTKPVPKLKTNENATSKNLELQRLQDARFKLETTLSDLVAHSAELSLNLVTQRKQYIASLRAQIEERQSQPADPSAGSMSQELQQFLDLQDQLLLKDIEEWRIKTELMKRPKKEFKGILKQETDMIGKVLSNFLTLRSTKAELVEKGVLFDCSYELPENFHKLSGSDFIEVNLFEELEKTLEKKGLVFTYRDLTRKHKLKLGEGAYSKVTQGWLNGRLVAVKKLKVHRGSTVKSFIREVQALRECAENPHVIRFLGATTKAPKLCIITPYLKGGSLHDMIYKKRVRFQPDQAFRIAQEVAEGMVMVHAAGIIHRDLTPNNILMHPDENGKSFIADFGIAVREPTQPTSRSSSVVAISPKGHPRYKCPEIVNSTSHNRPPITRKVDVYMFGTILYTLYHNKRPYEKLEDKDVVEKMCRGEYPEMDATVPLAIQDIIYACWNIDPAKRPNFDEVSQLLVKSVAKCLRRSKSVGMIKTGDSRVIVPATRRVDVITAL